MPPRRRGDLQGIIRMSVEIVNIVTRARIGRLRSRLMEFRVRALVSQRIVSDRQVSDTCFGLMYRHEDLVFTTIVAPHNRRHRTIFHLKTNIDFQREITLKLLMKLLIYSHFFRPVSVACHCREYVAQQSHRGVRPRLDFQKSWIIRTRQWRRIRLGRAYLRAHRRSPISSRAWQPCLSACPAVLRLQVDAALSRRNLCPGCKKAPDGSIRNLPNHLSPSLIFHPASDLIFGRRCVSARCEQFPVVSCCDIEAGGPWI